MLTKKKKRQKRAGTTQSAVRAEQGPISESGFSDNSELIRCDLGEAQGFQVQKAASA